MDRLKEIEKLKNQLKELEKEEKEFSSLSIDKQLAEQLHEKMCHHNHTDMCDWYYGNWNKPSSAHKRYLETAQESLKISDAKTILKIADCLKNI